MAASVGCQILSAGGAEANGPGVAQRDLTKIEIGPAKAGGDVAFGAIKTPGSAGNIDPVEVIRQNSVRVRSWVRGQKGVLKEDSVSRLGHPMVPDVVDVPIDSEHLDFHCTSQIASRNTVRAEAYRRGALGWIKEISQDTTTDLLTMRAGGSDSRGIAKAHPSGGDQKHLC
jgi:hypothetical protein